MKHHLKPHDERVPLRLTPTRGRSSMMVYFRERIDLNLVKKINQKMVKNFQEKTKETESKKEGNKKKGLYRTYSVEFG